MTSSKRPRRPRPDGERKRVARPGVDLDLATGAVSFIEQNQDRPFFLYLAHNTPHIPLAAKPELIEKHKDAWNPIYAAMIESMDDCVGRIMA